MNNFYIISCPFLYIINYTVAWTSFEYQRVTYSKQIPRFKDLKHNIEEKVQGLPYLQE